MRRSFIVLMLLLAAATMTFGFSEARAEVAVRVGAPGFSFSLNDYQSAPPNVRIYESRGRPYYVEHERRVYMEKKHHGHKKYKKHYKNNGRKNGHGKH